MTQQQKSPLIGSHESMVSIKETARKVAGTDLGVLIRGEWYWEGSVGSDDPF